MRVQILVGLVLAMGGTRAVKSLGIPSGLGSCYHMVGLGSTKTGRFFRIAWCDLSVNDDI